MFALYKKEILSFISSLTGYLVMLLFLLATGLFLWVFPGTDFNIPESGYAGLEGLFMIAPWVFMFLIPAVTMRSFAEEKKSGTIELLLTRPITDLQMVLAKFFAGLSLVLFTLIPTLIYFYSVYKLATPTGNVDTGAIWGSYIGLFFLASGYVAIGIFCSSFTDNQIISFVTSLFLCFIFYSGFDSISAFELFGKTDIFIQQLGMHAHFISLSRGVVDTRDVVYFISVASVFILFAKMKIRSRSW